MHFFYIKICIKTIFLNYFRTKFQSLLRIREEKFLKYFLLKLFGTIKDFGTTYLTEK